MDIAARLRERYPDATATEAWRTTFFYMPGSDQDYFATVDEVDGHARLNLGLPKGAELPGRWQPHPEYGRIGWVSLVGPDEAEWEAAGPLIGAAYRHGILKHERRAN